MLAYCSEGSYPNLASTLGSYRMQTAFLDASGAHYCLPLRLPSPG